MNRIIKFRAWDTENKKMYSCDWLSVLPGGIRFTWIDPNRDEVMVTSLKDYEIMQFTGLHDKNGKEIYEGDVLLCSDYVEDAHSYNTWKRTVVYDEDSASFLGIDGEKNEVIGNIYENH